VWIKRPPYSINSYIGPFCRWKPNVNLFIYLSFLLDDTLFHRKRKCCHCHISHICIDGTCRQGAYQAGIADMHIGWIITGSQINIAVAVTLLIDDFNCRSSQHLAPSIYLMCRTGWLFGIPPLVELKLPSAASGQVSWRNWTDCAFDEKCLIIMFTSFILSSFRAHNYVVLMPWSKPWCLHSCVRCGT